MIDRRQRLPDLIANLRDLGGIPLDGTAVVRPGRLLRSAALVQLPPSSLDALTQTLGAGTYFDLRTDVEVERDGGAEQLVSRGWQWRRLPVQDEADDRVAPLERYRAAMPRCVTVACDIAWTLPATEVALIACSIGKDRTGLVVALLLHWLGAARADIAADFMLSNACLADQRHLLPRRWREGGSEVALVFAEACMAALDLADVLVPAEQMSSQSLKLRSALAVPSQEVPGL